MRCFGRCVCLLVSAVSTALAAQHVDVAQLKELVASARAGGASDQQIADLLTGVTLQERLTRAQFPEKPGPKTKMALRILAAESAFLRPPAAAIPRDPPPAPDEQRMILAQTRNYTVNYIRNLPNFVCTRITRRYDNAMGSGPLSNAFRLFSQRDITSSELTYNRGEESDAPHIVDRPTCGKVPEGLTSYGEFGSIIAALFADGFGAPFTWSHWETIGGRRAAVFAYAKDQAHSTYTITWCCRVNGRRKVPRQVRTAYRGEVSVDPETGAILRVTRRAAPRSFPTHRTDTMVEYQSVEVGGRSFLCPVRSVTIAESRAGNSSVMVHYLNETRFANYHKFEANSVLRFGLPLQAGPVAPGAPALPRVAVAGKTTPADDCSVEAASAELDEAPSEIKILPAGDRAANDVHFKAVRFSPDGQYVLAQDDSGVSVLTVQPFQVRFRAPAENATAAEFTPDSAEIVFISSATHADALHISFSSHAARVEHWSVADRRQSAATGIVLPACETLGLSPDGRSVACVDFQGTLRLLDVSTGTMLFEKKKFGAKFVTDYGAWGDPGSARIDFSPDGRFVIVSPGDAYGSTLAWDLRERTRVKLTGVLASLRESSYAFVGPDRLILSRVRHAMWKDVSEHLLVSFPSAKVYSRPNIPAGLLFHAADPGFVLVRPFKPFLPTSVSTGQQVVRAIALHGGDAITKETTALDVFGDRYVAERADGELELHEKGGSQFAKLVSRDNRVRISGRVVRIDDTQLVLRTAERGELTLSVADGTQFAEGAGSISRRGIQPGDFVDVDTAVTDEHKFHARTVTRTAGVAREIPAKDIPSAASPPEDAFLREARRIAIRLSGSLPDYRCLERVTRYRSANHASTLWKREDVVSAEIVHRQGVVRLKLVHDKRSDPQEVGTGTWSAGDFNAVLADVLEPSSTARLKYREEAKLGEVAAVSYSFHIDGEHSRWVVKEREQTIRLGREGTIWFHPQTKQVLRIQFQGVGIPSSFREESVELAIDYAYVPLGGEKYLVPTHAEQQGCLRGVAFCTKNTIEFRDYRPMH